MREETFAREKKLGVIPADAELTPRPKELPAWDSLPADEKKLLAHQAEVYAGFLAQTDYEVGRLLQAIQEEGKADNTLVFYIVGDNGASLMTPRLPLLPSGLNTRSSSAASSSAITMRQHGLGDWMLRTNGPSR